MSLDGEGKGPAEGVFPVTPAVERALARLDRQIGGSPNDTLDFDDMSALFGERFARAIGVGHITDADSAKFRKLTQVIE